jgi:hypothetical protein
MLTRRILLATPLLLAMPKSALAEATTFYRNPGCECCHKWGELLSAQGIPVVMQDHEDLPGYLEKLGLRADLQGCHGGVIGGYVISGHVPPDDIKRLIAEHPAALGLAVPGMPSGSTGMETSGAGDKYEVLLVAKDGSTTVFATYG